MTEIPLGYVSPGHWFRVLDAGRRIIGLSCPGCGAIGYLSETHEITKDGAVSPSVECECGFHDFIRLLDYATDETRR